MAEEKPTWLELIADAARRIATPVAQHSVFIIALTWLACSIAGITEISVWKGCLLSVVLVIFGGIVGVSMWMSIYKPRHLTFDKDAHKEIDVNAAKGATVFDQVEIEREDDQDNGDRRVNSTTAPERVMA
jgi:hypothetical protein